MFVKPNAGGSSFGVTKVKSMDQLEEAVHKSWSESEEALIESFIEGKEFTCGAVKIKNELTVFPLTEVLPKNEFFDFEAKYTPRITSYNVCYTKLLRTDQNSMKGKALRYIIILATISITGVFLIQFVFIRYSYKFV